MIPRPHPPARTNPRGDCSRRGTPLSLFGVLGLLLLPAAMSASTARVTNGLVAYFPFTEGAGTTVADHAPAGIADDLELTGTYGWLPGQNGVHITGGRIGSPCPPDPTAPDPTGPNLPLVDALAVTGESTFEAWVVPEDLVQSGPARIVSLGELFMLGQSGNDIQVNLRHTGKTLLGEPALVTSNGPLDGG